MPARTLLLAGALLLGCEASHADLPTPAQSVEPSATPQPVALSSRTSAAPSSDGLEEFEHALARKLDPARWRTRPATPQGGVLHIPDGQAGHAAILIKNRDGSLRRECVSSSAEVSALVQEIRRERAR